jgi:hypothetical protein
VEEVDDNTDYRDALRLGLRRAGLHWVRASYEVLAGVGAFLDEVANVRRGETPEHDEDPGDDGPVRIELDD